MNGLRKPRQPRQVHHDQLGRALKLASCFPPAEVAMAMKPINISFTSLRRGVANETEWAILVSALNMADALETHALRLGTRGHVQAGQLALDQVMRRAMARGFWSAVEVHLQEIDDIRVAIEIHEDQLRQVDQGGYRRAQQYAISEVRSTGGVVLDMKPAGEQLAIAGV